MSVGASVRGIIIDDDGRVLLIKWRRPADGVRFWLCAGGGVEDGENDAMTLARELSEETGLTEFEPGPHVATWRWENSYEHRFYLVRCANFEPATGEGHPDYEVFEEYRWWSADEVAEYPDLMPAGLGGLLAALSRGDVPQTPIEWFD